MSAKSWDRVLITGAGGQLAQALMNAAPQAATCIGVSRAELDICDEVATQRVLENARPTLVINGAAYNLVDKAEGEGATAALDINAIGVANLAKTCRDLSVPLLHFSTDFVFDGQKSTPYIETDATRPLSIYGASKLAGENIALLASPHNVVVRVCRLFGPVAAGGAGSERKPAGNFPSLMLRLARERGKVCVVNDQIGNPSYTPDLARAVWQLVEKADGGLFHLCSAGEVAFDEYARTVFELAGVSCEVESLSSDEYGAAAQRPKYSVLDNSKAHRHGVTPLRHWKDALREYLSL